jgi:ABC-2 type transport system permease protein
MTIRGVLIVAAVERAKLAAQAATLAILTACLFGPFLFVEIVKLQSVLPEDTLFGRGIKDSGLAAPLVVLGFASLWAFPALASVVAGDLFSSEDRYATWPLVLTRARSRQEVFAGKLLIAVVFALAAIVILAASSVAAGTLLIGTQPMIDLSGVELAPRAALFRIALAWATVLPPVLAFAAIAILISIATRSSAAGIGLPVLLGFVMQLTALIDMPDGPRRLLLTPAFDGWHGLLVHPAFSGPLVYGAAISFVCFVVCTLTAYVILRKRDIGG